MLTKKEFQIGNIIGVAWYPKLRAVVTRSNYQLEGSTDYISIRILASVKFPIGKEYPEENAAAFFCVSALEQLAWALDE